jgi:hypothetical protein
MRRYDVLAVDLDGTLLGPGGVLSPGSVRAMHMAREAGMRTVVCTGRGLAECRHVTEAIGQTDPVAVAGGAIIACPVTAATLHRFGLGRAVVAHAVEVMLGMGHAALVLKDPVAAGYDYLVVRGAAKIELDPVTRWWFESMNVRVREVASLEEDEHPEHTVRVGACGRASFMERVRGRLHERYGDEVIVHSFGAVVAPGEVKTTEEGETLHVLEAFDRGANKRAAIEHVAAGWGVPMARVAAIGDEVNDVALIAGVEAAGGLGVAMANAIPAVKAAASRETASNREDGVAAAVEKMVRGEW